MSGKIPIVLLGLLLILVSCKPPGDYLDRTSIDIEIDNQTGNELAGVNVFVVQQLLVNGTYREVRTDSSHVGVITKASRANGVLHEKDVAGTDGSYLMTATGFHGKKYTHRFGYLTNGSFLEKKLYVTVKPDTVIVKR